MKQGNNQDLAWGGKRRGAGRPRKGSLQEPLPSHDPTPLDIFLRMMKGDTTVTEAMFRAAVEAAPYVHPRAIAPGQIHEAITAPKVAKAP